MARKPNVHVDITGLVQQPAGFHDKHRIIMHETVSHDEEGLSDIKNVASFLGSRGLGVQAIIDQEGHLGLTRYNTPIYYHCYGDNTYSLGIELISYIPGKNISRWERFRIWLSRERQLHKAARLIAWWSGKHNIPIRFQEGKGAGVTTHWNSSRVHGVVGGHWDCWPKHQGGHFPIKRLVKLAKGYKAGTIIAKPMKFYKLGQST